MSTLLLVIDVYLRAIREAAGEGSTVRMEDDRSVVVLDAEGQVLGAATGPTVELALQALLSLVSCRSSEVV